SRRHAMRFRIAPPFRFSLRPVCGPTVVEDLDAAGLDVLRTRLVLVGDVPRAIGTLEDLLRRGRSGERWRHQERDQPRRVAKDRCRPPADSRDEDHESCHSTPASAQRHAVARSPGLKYTRSQMAVPTPTPLHSPTRPRPIGVSSTAEPEAIAQATLEGFNHHYALFRDCARAAKNHFEASNWLAIAHTSQDRIDF